MGIFSSIMEKLGMGRRKPEPDIRPLPGRVPGGAGAGATTQPGAAGALPPGRRSR